MLVEPSASPYLHRIKDLDAPEDPSRERPPCIDMRVQVRPFLSRRSSTQQAYQQAYLLVCWKLCWQKLIRRVWCFVVVLGMQLCSVAQALCLCLCDIAAQGHLIKLTKQCCCCYWCCLFTANFYRCWLLTGATRTRRWCCLCGMQQTCGHCLQSKLLPGQVPHMLTGLSLLVHSSLSSKAWTSCLFHCVWS
jgi:hypothetical protein